MTDQDEWWCALCPTSHPSEEALIAHKAAKHPTTAAGTSAQLRQTQTDLAASQADLTRALAERDRAQDQVAELVEMFQNACNEAVRFERERDELASTVAGWVARFHAAYEALYIEEFDGDSCPDLETTIDYAVRAYRRVCESEAAAADQLQAERDRHRVLWRIERDACVQLRQRLLAAESKRDLAAAELATARAELERLRNQTTNPEGAS